jgi:hypothetical protein
MKNLLIILIITILGLSFSSCEKQANMKEIVTAKVNSPTEDAMMNNGGSLNVNVTFTDPTELHNYSIIVLDENTNTTVLDISGHTHETSYTVDSIIILSVAAHSAFKVTAVGTNHSGETATDIVNFEVHP